MQFAPAEGINSKTETKQNLAYAARRLSACQSTRQTRNDPRAARDDNKKSRQFCKFYARQTASGCREENGIWNKNVGLYVKAGLAGTYGVAVAP